MHLKFFQYNKIYLLKIKEKFFLILKYLKYLLCYPKRYKNLIHATINVKKVLNLSLYALLHYIIIFKNYVLIIIINIFLI